MAEKIFAHKNYKRTLSDGSLNFAVMLQPSAKLFMFMNLLKVFGRRANCACSFAVLLLERLCKWANGWVLCHSNERMNKGILWRKLGVDVTV